jgi:cytochrome c-type biogenesis protein
MPDIQQLYEENQADEDSDLVILAVAFPGYGDEKDEGGIRDFLDENGYTYPTLMDEGATLAAQYYISAFPTTFMIDKEGSIFGYVPGSMSKEIMESIIQQTREVG